MFGNELQETIHKAVEAQAAPEKPSLSKVFQVHFRRMRQKFQNAPASVLPLDDSRENQDLEVQLLLSRVQAAIQITLDITRS